MKRAASPRGTFDYIFVANFSLLIDLNVSAHAALWGEISVSGLATRYVYPLWVNFVINLFNLWPISWPLYAKASPSSRLMLAAVAVICPRRPMASRGSKALRVNLEHLNHGPHGVFTAKKTLFPQTVV